MFFDTSSLLFEASSFLSAYYTSFSVEGRSGAASQGAETNYGFLVGCLAVGGDSGVGRCTAAVAAVGGNSICHAAGKLKTRCLFFFCFSKKRMASASNKIDKESTHHRLDICVFGEKGREAFFFFFFHWFVDGSV